MNNADFHFILYADGFWSEKKGTMSPISHEGEPLFSPSDDDSWDQCFHCVDTYYVFYNKQCIK